MNNYLLQSFIRSKKVENIYNLMISRFDSANKDSNRIESQKSQLLHLQTYLSALVFREFKVQNPRQISQY